MKDRCERHFLTFFFLQATCRVGGGESAPRGVLERYSFSYKTPMRTNACGGGERGDARAAALVVAALGRLVAVALRVRRPQRQVVSQQLHDQRRVLVRVLVQCVQLRDRVIERLFGELTRLVW